MLAAMNLPGPGGSAGDPDGGDRHDPDRADAAPTAGPDGAAARAARRRRLDRIFGDVLPDTTGDERDTARADGDRWYRENRPPHHG